jgi:radical SAM protein with 4Fe4S-binding SPASM domain
MQSVVAAEWIRWARDEGIPSVRFTGGEPTLEPTLLSLCELAKTVGLRVTLNTNALSDHDLLDRLVGIVDTVKVSLPVLEEGLSDSITGVRGSLTRKLQTTVLALEAGFEVELLTVMIPENIGLVDSFLTLARSLPGARWVPLRLESSSVSLRPLTRGMVQSLATELHTLKKQHSLENLRLRLATPFCAVTPIELGAQVFSGRAEDCGPFKNLTVDPMGHLISCYSCREELPSKISLEQVLQAQEVRQLIDKESLPAKCQTCDFVDRCMGGCFSPHALVEERGGRIDYLGADNGQ